MEATDSKDNRMSDSLHRQRDALRAAEQRILDKMRRPTQGAQDEHKEQMTFGEHVADKLAQLVGSWTFILSYLTMHHLEKRILGKMRGPAQTAHDADAQHEAQTSFGEHMADKLAQSAGKWTFILSYLAMHRAEQHVLDKVRRPARAAQAQHEDQMTLGERLVHKLAQSAGKWTLLLGLLALVAQRRHSGAAAHAEPERASGAQ